MQVIFIMQQRYVPVLIRFLPHQNILAQQSISAPRFPSDFCLIKTQWCFLISISKLKMWFGLVSWSVLFICICFFTIMSICLQAWRKNVWEVISDPLLTFLKVKKKKKKDFDDPRLFATNAPGCTAKWWWLWLWQWWIYFLSMIECLCKKLLQMQSRLSKRLYQRWMLLLVSRWI